MGTCVCPYACTPFLGSEPLLHCHQDFRVTLAINLCQLLLSFSAVAPVKRNNRDLHRLPIPRGLRKKGPRYGCQDHKGEAGLPNLALFLTDPVPTQAMKPGLLSSSWGGGRGLLRLGRHPVKLPHQPHRKLSRSGAQPQATTGSPSPRSPRGKGPGGPPLQRPWDPQRRKSCLPSMRSSKIARPERGWGWERAKNKKHGVWGYSGGGPRKHSHPLTRVASQGPDQPILFNCPGSESV